MQATHQDGVFAGRRGLNQPAVFPCFAEAYVNSSIGNPNSEANNLVASSPYDLTFESFMSRQSSFAGR